MSSPSTNRASDKQTGRPQSQDQGQHSDQSGPPAGYHAALHFLLPVLLLPLFRLLLLLWRLDFIWIMSFLSHWITVQKDHQPSALPSHSPAPPTTPASLPSPPPFSPPPHVFFSASSCSSSSYFYSSLCILLPLPLISVWCHPPPRLCINLWIFKID